MTRFSLVEQAHAFIEAVVEQGDTVIDATVGNGHDTLFLARLVGGPGKVFGFDIQQEALDSAWQRLEEAGETAQVSLYHAGHEVMALVIPSGYQSRVKAVMFNLGYLPGSDKMKITRESTTLAALQSALAYLAPGGRISVLAYTGHPGGREEAEAIKAWAANLNSTLFRLQVVLPPVTSTHSPELLMIERQLEGGEGV